MKPRLFCFGDSFVDMYKILHTLLTIKEPIVEFESDPKQII